MNNETKNDDRLATLAKEYNRVRLADQLPLDTPFGLCVDTNHSCNLLCEFCIHTSKHMERNMYKEPMDMDTFDNLILGIKLFPRKLKALHFCPFGEPLLHRNIIEMVKIAKEQKVAEKIDMLTNGVLLTKEMSFGLVNAGIDWIRISLNGLSDEEFWNYCERKVSFKDYLNNLTYLYNNKGNTKIYIKIMDYMVNDIQKREVFFNTFQPISDAIAIEFCQDHHDAKK